MIRFREISDCLWLDDAPQVRKDLMKEVSRRCQVYVRQCEALHREIKKSRSLYHGELRVLKVSQTDLDRITEESLPPLGGSWKSLRFCYGGISVWAFWSVGKHTTPFHAALLKDPEEPSLGVCLKSGALVEITFRGVGSRPLVGLLRGGYLPVMSESSQYLGLIDDAWASIKKGQLELTPESEVFRFSV